MLFHRAQIVPLLASVAGLFLSSVGPVVPRKGKGREGQCKRELKSVNNSKGGLIDADIKVLRECVSKRVCNTESVCKSVSYRKIGKNHHNLPPVTILFPLSPFIHTLRSTGTKHGELFGSVVEILTVETHYMHSIISEFVLLASVLLESEFVLLEYA